MEEYPYKEIEVTVSVTMSKTIKVKVNDYEIVESDRDDEKYSIDYSNCNLKKAVEEQAILPQDAYKYVNPYTFSKHQIINDLEDWCVDDYQVELG